MRSRSVRRTGLAVLAALALAGCGSTVNVGSDASSLAGSIDVGLGGPTSTTPQETGTSSGDSPVAGSTSGTGSATNDVTGPGEALPSDLPTDVATAIKNVPAKADIKIGIFTSEATTKNAAYRAFQSVPKIDPTLDFKTIISYYNARGGFGGHKLVPVFYIPDSSSTFEEQEQQACTKFTQDNKVTFALSTNGADKTWVACMERTKTPIFLEFPGYYYRLLFQRSPGMIYGVAFPEQQDLLWNWIASLGRQGFFSNVKKPKVAFVMPGTEAGVANIKKVVPPALKKLGLNLDDLGQYQVGNSASSQVAALALRFKQEGITHVIHMDVGGFTNTYFFMTAANSQGYYPRNAINSANTPDFLRRNVPKAQLKGSMGLSWIPILDAGPGSIPPDNAPAKECMSAYQKGGIVTGDQTTKGALLWYCEMVQFVKHVLDKSSTNLTASGLFSTISSLGSSFVAARGGPTYFSRDTFTGGSTYWDLSYNEAKGYYVIDYSKPHRIEHWIG